MRQGTKGRGLKLFETEGCPRRICETDPRYVPRVHNANSMRSWGHVGLRGQRGSTPGLSAKPTAV